MALLETQKKNVGHPDELIQVGVDGLITRESAALHGVEVHRVTFNVGAKTARPCALPHIAYVLSGRLSVRMVNGSEEVYGPEDVMMLPPGHHAWTVGDKPCAFIEFSRGCDYYRNPWAWLATAPSASRRSCSPKCWTTIVDRLPRDIQTGSTGWGREMAPHPRLRATIPSAGQNQTNSRWLRPATVAPDGSAIPAEAMVSLRVSFFTEAVRWTDLLTLNSARQGSNLQSSSFVNSARHARRVRAFLRGVRLDAVATLMDPTNPMTTNGAQAMVPVTGGVVGEERLWLAPSSGFGRHPVRNVPVLFQKMENLAEAAQTL